LATFTNFQLFAMNKSNKSNWNSSTRQMWFQTKNATFNDFCS